MLFKNFSTHKFDQDTEDLIQKGATFVPLPRTVNKTEVLASIKRFERRCLWKAHWAMEESDQNDVYIPPLFHVVKDNLPYTNAPKPLKDALVGIRTEILSSPLNHVSDNLRQSERTAMKNLVELRSKGEIVIQPLDKTGGLAVFDRMDYVKGMDQILNEKNLTPDDNLISNYQEVSQQALIDGKKQNKRNSSKRNEFEILKQGRMCSNGP